MGIRLTNGGTGERRRTYGAPRRPMSEINVTPFVDVVLVLLVIFIVAAPLLTVGVPIELPKTAATPLASESEEPLTLTVFADGRVAIQTTEVPLEELGSRLRSIMAERASPRIYLRGDREAKYEFVMQVMGALNKDGFRDIGLVTDGGGPDLDSIAN
ncbi:MAG: biopolymer transporter ExbD [Albidovulum sp.]|nr:biopolymer transporter ExbD [Albidovulum sp.]MDE0304277.1 biopolymer transporter ExbD [Albidovulum sp.]MDE0531564.1 biopolymer transporter ExbD [Albidovulum sp.]